MNSPATHPASDEERRLNALHRLHVLDTPPEAVLDALVRAAALACEVPIALISLVDKDRLWFKANVGLPGVEGLARHGSFCDQAIRGHDVLEVTDARSDAQFACAALVTDPPHIQFYAGAPIEMPGGLRMGTLCVLHREPHRLTPSQKQILRELAVAAAQVMGAETALRVSEEKFRTLSDSSPFGVYHTDANGRCTYTNGQWQTIYGLSLAESLGDKWASTLHPEDKAAVFAEWQASVEESRDFNMEFRILRGDGQVRDVKSKARAIRTADGEIGGYVGGGGGRDREAAARQPPACQRGLIGSNWPHCQRGWLDAGFAQRRHCVVRPNPPHPRHRARLPPHFGAGHCVLRSAGQARD
jgi:diguanylate cyclase